MGLCHLQENASFQIFTQTCIFYGISRRGRPIAAERLRQSSLRGEIPYDVKSLPGAVGQTDAVGLPGERQSCGGGGPGKQCIV